MRIGFDATILRDQPAGVENSVSGTLRALLELSAGDEYVVYCGRRFRAPDWLRRPEVRLRRAIVDSRRALLRVFWQQLRLPFLAAGDRLDVFHGPAYVLPRYLAAPAVLTAPDAIALSHPELLRKASVAHLRRFLPAGCRQARRIIVPSRASALALERHAGADPARIRVVPHGVGAEYRPIPDRELLAKVRRTLQLPERFALFVGQIEPKKNLIRLVEAFFAARANQRLPHKLIVVGRPAWRWRRVFMAVRDLGMSQDVVFTGYLPGEVLPYLYNLAEALLFPSLVEGFGLPALEAAACGAPVLISADPALVEVAGEAALSVPAGSLPELRAGIERVLTDGELRRRLSEAGPRRAAQFSWERAARATREVYAEALEEERRAAPGPAPTPGGAP